MIGQRIGPFAIDKELGAGAMGAVYRARYEKTGQRVAIKVIAAGLGTNDKIAARFQREAAILKQLKHPNIVRLLAVGKYKGSPFYAMEYVEGETLADVLLRRDRYTWEEVVEIGKQLCAALQHAHANGIIHRDLKPSNLMITRDGTVKLTDFGIAKDLDRTGLTTAHCTVGTAAYMSPEQCRGEQDLTNKSDLYSLGIMLYELLTGRKPFNADNAIEMFVLHAQGTFERPSRITLEMPVWLDTLVCQLLEKKPEHRPLDAALVGKALADVQEKVATLKSAGVDVARRVARKGENRSDKEAAKTLLKAGKKAKKRKTDYGKIATATTLLIALALIIGLAIWALRPEGPEKAYQEGVKLVDRGDALIDQGDLDNVSVVWYDAQHKYLEKIAEDAAHPFAEQAKQQLEYIKQGLLYVKGARNLKGEVKDWRTAKTAGFDELLDKHPAGNKFVERARIELEPFEAPRLVNEGIDLARQDDSETRKKGFDKLNLLLKRYPKSEQIKKAWPFLAEQEALAELKEAAKAGRAPTSVNRAKEQALEALQLEQAKKPDEARAKWTQLRDWGRAPIPKDPDQKRPVDNPDFQPWIWLAEEKLRGK